MQKLNITIMDDPVLQQMMHWLENGPKEAFKAVLIIYTLFLAGALLGTWLLHWLVFWLTKSKITTLVALTLSVIFIGIFAVITVRSWQNSKRTGVNRTPYSFGIYTAYYQCSKCNSIHGGIYGKGPTHGAIKDDKCIHDWQAIHKEDFEAKFIEISRPEGGAI